MKRIVFLVVLLCALTVFASSAFAAQVTATLDVRSMPTTDNLATDGWSWDAGTLTLTLDGVDIDATQCGIRLPGGATIVLVDGSTNTITTRASGPANVGISAAGSLVITNSSGTGTSGELIIRTATGESTFGMNGTGSLTFEAGTVDIITADASVQTYQTYSCGVWFDGSISILGGSLSAVAGNGPNQSYGIASGTSITIGQEGQPGPIVNGIGKDSGNPNHLPDSNQQYSAGIMAPRVTLNSGTVSAQAGTSPRGASSLWAWGGPTNLVVAPGMLPPGVTVGMGMVGPNVSTVLLSSSGDIITGPVELEVPLTPTSASSVVGMSVMAVLALGFAVKSMGKKDFIAS